MAKSRLGVAQLDVLDSVRLLGPFTVAALAEDTGRIGLYAVVASLVRIGRLIDYGGSYDVPCDRDMTALIIYRGVGRCHYDVSAIGVRRLFCEETHQEDCTWGPIRRTRSGPSMSTPYVSAAPSCSALIQAQAGT